MRIRYSRWDDSQDPFGPDVAASELLDDLSEEILSGAGADGALDRLLRRGMPGRFRGLDQLRERLRSQRARAQDALDLRGPLEEIRRELDDVIDRERNALTFEVGDDARTREV